MSAWSVPGSLSLNANDDGAWLDVVERTGGVVWRATVTCGIPAAADEMKPSLQRSGHRPMRLRHVRILRTGGGPRAPRSIPMAVADPEAEAVELLHDLIARRFAGPSSKVSCGASGWRSFCCRTPARPGCVWRSCLVSTCCNELTQPEMMVLVRRGRAVSPVTCYLAIKPGVLGRATASRRRRCTGRAPRCQWTASPGCRLRRRWCRSRRRRSPAKIRESRS